MTWTTPADIQAKVRKLWDSGRLIAAGLRGEPMFPLSISLVHPSPGDLSARFEESQHWIRELENGASGIRGFGYVLVFTEINNRRIGKNNLPTSVTLLTEADALRWIGKVREATLIRSLYALTLEKIPELGPLVISKPMKILDHADKWERLLAVLDWLRNHPCPGIYVRQMDLPGVDTKFVQACEGILIELFRAMSDGPTTGVDEARDGRKSFEDRFGFLSKPALVRFRILDPRLQIQGLTDLSAPVNEVASLALPVSRVFITENMINGLAFPPMEASLVIFGLGYGVDTLSAIPWLGTVDIFYWGDIDTHGFAILDRLRSAFPQCRSLLMDRETLMAHRDYWVEESTPIRTTLSRLTPEESAVYAELVGNEIQNNLRLEQERIGFHWLEKALGTVPTQKSRILNQLPDA